MPKGQIRDIVRVRNFLLRDETDIWDESLWIAFHKKNQDTFNGDVKELNKAFLQGAKLYINKPAAFKHFDDGFVAGCGWSIETLARRVTNKWRVQREDYYGWSDEFPDRFYDENGRIIYD